MFVIELLDLGSENVTKLLIDSGADVNLSNYEDFSPLIAAAVNGNSYFLFPYFKVYCYIRFNDGISFVDFKYDKWFDLFQQEMKKL